MHVSCYIYPKFDNSGAIPENVSMIELTEPAVKKIRELQEQNAAEDKVLRIFVEPGGCSGFEYGMSFAGKQPGDVEAESGGVRFCVDSASTAYLEGSVIDFDDSLHGKGFEFRNPKAQSTCGCGRSFS